MRDANLSRLLATLTPSERLAVEAHMAGAPSKESKPPRGGFDSGRGENRMPANGWWSMEDLTRERNRKARFRLPRRFVWLA